MNERESGEQDPMADEILLEEMVMAIVSKPAAVRVIPSSGRPKLLKLSVAAADRGRVIGKNGRTIETIRGFMATVGANFGYGIEVELENLPRRRRRLDGRAV